MKYSLSDVYDNVFRMIDYVVEIMRKEGLNDEEIMQYRVDALSDNCYHAITLSEYYVYLCNRRHGDEE